MHYVLLCRLEMQQFVFSSLKHRAEIDVEDVSIQLDTCADSTQTLGDLFNCLKPPIEIDEGSITYPDISDVDDSIGKSCITDILKDIDENAFSGGFNVAQETMMPVDDDLVDDDVPFNLAFVESYYGDQSKMKMSPDQYS